MASAAVMKRKVIKRKSVRTQFSKVLHLAEEYLTSEEVLEEKLLSFEASLRNKVKELKKLDEEIEDMIEVEALEKSVEESLEFLEPSHDVFASLAVRLNKLKSCKTGSTLGEVASTTSSTKVNCRLPKLEIPFFSGNPLEWQGFWDQFSVSVNSNEAISEVEKFNYLLRFLKDKALSVVKGLTLSNENYVQALRLLKERFGNPQVLISAHLDALIKIKKVKSIDNVESLRKLYNEVETSVRNLRALDVETKTYGCLLIPMLKEKLPEEMLMVISRGFSGRVWKLDEFMEFFNTELQAKESCFSFKNKVEVSLKTGDSFTSAGSLHVQSESSKCVYCLENHSPVRCEKVTDVNSRKNILKRFSKCFLCLKGGHVARNCRLSYVCFKCKGKHHISICKAPDTLGNKGTDATRVETRVGHVGVSNGILLQTAQAKVFGTETSRGLNARIIFDSGSQRSYISDKLSKTLNLETVRTERVILNAFGQTNSTAQSLDVVRLRIKNDNSGEFLSVDLFSVAVVCSPLKKQNLSMATRNFPRLKTLKLADFHHGSEDIGVDILIGLDVYHNFFTGKVIRTNGPTANESIFGWVLSGPISDLPSIVSSHTCFTSHVMRCSVNIPEQETDLRQDLDKFWQIESLQGPEECVIHKFEKDISFNGERYVTKLPFRPDHDALPSNFDVSKQRLKNLRGRLEKQNLISTYDGVFKEYEKEKIIEKVQGSEIICEPSHYLPHRGVLREDKETTKLRIVFDASCSSNGPSLNDCLYPGPNLLSKIFDILMRFRMNPIAIISDIKQAFLNIEIERTHQNFLRFLWFEDPFDPCSEIVVYRFLRLVFGLTSSPFILNATIRHHLEKFVKDCVFVERFLEDLYVDDSVSGCSSVEEGRRFYDKSKSMLLSGGFVLRKWVTNNKDLQAFFDSREGSVYDVKNGCVKVLGLEWDFFNDEFVFNCCDILDMARSLSATKRNVLKVAATFFDPIGFIAPVTARVKSIFQLLCKDKSDWDTLVSGDVLNVWECFLLDMERLKVLRVSRFAFVDISAGWGSVTLHGFCDSSKTCYAAVVYLQIMTSAGNEVRFLSAKTKVAPLKEISIARLELLGCVLLSDLIKEVLDVLKGRTVIEKVKCWSDSQVALCWLKGKTKRWKPWVENRVVKVRKVVDCDDWFFIPGEMNPADIPTRICEEKDFVRWFRGPDFLWRKTFNVDCFDVEAKLNDAEVIVESRSSEPVTLSVVVGDEDINATTVRRDVANIIDCRNFGSIIKLINTTAYVLRFINNIKARKNGEDCIYDVCISSNERNYALELWLESEQINMRGKMVSSLKLFKDDRGIKRLKGRFGSSSIEYDVKHPIIIGGGDRHFTKLIVRDAHERVMHTGVEATLNFIRRKYWIVKGRKSVKDIIRHCVICKRFQGRTCASPDSPDLPEFRYSNSFCFCNVGLDFAGPLYVRDNTAKAAATAKVYILLFTCASSRAVHLELVPDMKSSAFLRAFTRFVSRKGQPKLIVSDNFRTFKSTEVKKHLANLNIKQQFILPASPWWGGFYERLVRSTKLALKKTLGRSLLKYEELETVLCRAEFTINSRPLTYVSLDDLEEALTPFHLMFGRSLSQASSFNFNCDISETEYKSASKRLKYLQTLIKNYWNSFDKTYINELKQHHLYQKSKSSPQQVKLGDVVLIRDDLPLPRQRWRLGKIEDLIYGKDDVVRGVQLKTMSSDGNAQICYRPLQKIIPYEIVDEAKPPSSDSVEATDNVKRDNSTDDISPHLDVTCESSRRPKRRAAREGQLTRRLRENYFG